MGKLELFKNQQEKLNSNFTKFIENLLGKLSSFSCLKNNLYFLVVT